MSNNRPKEDTALGTLCKLMKVWYWPTNCTIFVCLTVRIRPVYAKWGRNTYFEIYTFYQFIQFHKKFLNGTVKLGDKEPFGLCKIVH